LRLCRSLLAVTQKTEHKKYKDNKQSANIGDDMNRTRYSGRKQCADKVKADEFLGRSDTGPHTWSQRKEADMARPWQEQMGKPF